MEPERIELSARDRDGNYRINVQPVANLSLSAVRASATAKAGYLGIVCALPEERHRLCRLRFGEHRQSGVLNRAELVTNRAIPLLLSRLRGKP